MRKPSGYGPSLIVLATAVIVLVAGPTAVQELAYRQKRVHVAQASARLSDNNILELLNQSYRDIATVVEPSVVHISAQQLVHTRRGDRITGLSSGSGWVYDAEGHIVTNHHVIEDATRIEVQLQSGDLREAELVGADQLTDIAVLKIKPGRLHPAIRADPDEPVQQGDVVFAFGSPFDFRFSMSQGVVSGMGRTVGVIRDEFGRWSGYENFIQVDAAINPGNSGGPLTDYRGRVIGMNTAIATGRREGDFEEGQFAGIGLAIPLYMIESAVDQIIERGYVTKGYLGVDPRDLNVTQVDFLEQAGHVELARHIREQNFLGRHIIVIDVPDTGPAGAAGIQPLDVITAIDGHPAPSFQHLRARISTMRPGETVDITVWRYDNETDSGEELIVPVELAPLDYLRVFGIPSPNHPKDSFVELGILRMETATRRTARHYNTRELEGVVIHDVAPGSQLDVEGIVPGSVIVAVAEYSVRDVDELFRFISRDRLDLNLGVPVTIIGADGSFHHPVILRIEG